MKRKEMLEAHDRGEVLCATITNGCPKCGAWIYLKDEDKLTGAYCSECEEKIDDDYVDYCGCGDA